MITRLDRIALFRTVPASSATSQNFAKESPSPIPSLDRYGKRG